MPDTIFYCNYTYDKRSSIFIFLIRLFLLNTTQIVRVMAVIRMARIREDIATATAVSTVSAGWLEAGSEIWRHVLSDGKPP